MKMSRSDKWICRLFILFLALMPLLFWLLPKQSFSAREKRYLAPAPTLSREELVSGRFGEEAEAWAADHLPGRDALVGLDALYELAAGRQTVRSVYLCRDGRLCEAPTAFDETVLARNLDALNVFAAASPVPVDLMLVPSAGFWLDGMLPALAEPYPDGAILDAVFDAAGENLVPVDLRPVFAAAKDPGALYYDIVVTPLSKTESFEEVLVITSLTEGQHATSEDIQSADNQGTSGSADAQQSQATNSDAAASNESGQKQG